MTATHRLLQRPDVQQRAWQLREQHLSVRVIAERLGLGKTRVEDMLRTERAARGIVLPARVRRTA